MMMKSKNVPKIRFKGFSEEWEEKRLGDITSWSKGSNLAKTVLNENSIGSSVIHYADLYKFYPVVDEVIHWSETEEGAEIPLNSLLFPMSDVTPFGLARTSTITKQGVKAGGDTLIGTIAENQLAKFMSYQINANAKEILPLVTGTTVRHISASSLSTLNIKLPLLDEQEKIGSFFKNLDNLIIKTEKQLTKLKNIKKTCLEKMFPKKGSTVPEIRFMGFTGEWEEKIMGKIGNTFSGLSGKTKDDFGHGDAKFVTYMNIFTNPIANRCGTETVEIDGKQNEVQYGDIFFTTSSETPEEVGMSSVWLSHDDNVYLNSFCFGYRLNEDVYPYFMSHLLRSPSIRKKIAFLAQGISRYNISKNKVMDISLPFPSPDEQEKIGSFFKNLDDLISQTEQQLTKLKNIKKACLEKMFVNTTDAL